MNLLKQLELDELSLVDRPANASAKVALFKRDSEEENMEKAYKMSDAEMEEMDKMSDDLKAKLRGYMGKGYTFPEAKKMMDEDMKKAMDEEVTLKVEFADLELTAEAELLELKEENENLRKQLGEVVEKKEEVVETIEVNGELVVKADIPEPVLKALEEAKVEKQMIELRKKAEAELPHFDVEVAMSLLDVIKGDAKVLEALKGADAAFAAAMDEVGEKVVEADMSDPQSKLDKMVDAYAEEHKVNKYAAFDAISKTAEGKSLIAKTYEKDE